MDQLIASYPKYELCEGVLLCPEHGVAYQADMNRSVTYGEDYFANYVRLEGNPIGRKLNEFRVALTSAYCTCLLDMGIGSGEFIKNSPAVVYGYDINPYGVAWLKERKLWVDPYEGIPDHIEGITLWDTMEHIPDPGKLLDLVKPKTYVFVSLPIFGDLQNDVTKSKHFKPDEHYYYWTEWGLKMYFDKKGFKCVATCDDETRAGRHSILSFVFRKV